MALQKTLVTEKTYYSPLSVEDFVVVKKDIPNAYVKIENIEGNKEQVKLLVDIYNEKNGNVLEHKSYSFAPALDIDSKNFLEQGYNYLKTLDEYKGAIDV